jgi:hypothetical protein
LLRLGAGKSRCASHWPVVLTLPLVGRSLHLAMGCSMLFPRALWLGRGRYWAGFYTSSRFARSPSCARLRSVFAAPGRLSMTPSWPAPPCHWTPGSAPVALGRRARTASPRMLISPELSTTFTSNGPIFRRTRPLGRFSWLFERCIRRWWIWPGYRPTASGPFMVPAVLGVAGALLSVPSTRDGDVQVRRPPGLRYATSAWATGFPNPGSGRSVVRWRRV